MCAIHDYERPGHAEVCEHGWLHLLRCACPPTRPVRTYCQHKPKRSRGTAVIDILRGVAVLLRKMLGIGGLPQDVRTAVESEGVIHLAEFVAVTFRFSR